MSRSTKHRYSKSRARWVVAIGEVSPDHRSIQIARMLTVNGLEQAQREAEAAQEHADRDLEDTTAEFTAQPDAGGGLS